MQVLVVHSDEKVLANLEKLISTAGCAAIVTGNIVSAKKFLTMAQVDAFVLEDHLPDGEGAEISASQKSLNVDAGVPTIFLHGTSDGWPIHYSTYSSPRLELNKIALIAALINTANTTPPVQLLCGPMSINLDGSVIVDGTVVKFSNREKQILISLALHQGQPMSSTRILSDIWGLQHDPSTNIVAVYIRNIRSKLLPHKLIKTIRGVGYLMDVPL